MTLTTNLCFHYTPCVLETVKTRWNYCVSFNKILRKMEMNNKTKKRVDVGTFHLFKNVLTSRWQWCEWIVFSIYLVTKPISPSIVHGCIEWCTVLTALPVLLRLFPWPCRCWCYYYLSRHHYFLSRVRRSPAHHVTSVLLCSVRCQVLFHLSNVKIILI